MSKEKSLNESKPTVKHMSKTGYKMKKADKILTKGIKSLVKAFHNATICGMREIEKEDRKSKNDFATEKKSEKKRGDKVKKMRK